MKLTRLTATAMLQILALVGLIGMQAYTLKTGTPVVLATQPIDPRDLFRGDHVILTYEITNLEAPEGLAGQARRGDTVWAILAPGDRPLDAWRLETLSLTRPDTREGHVALRGRIDGVRNRVAPVAPGEGAPGEGAPGAGPPPRDPELAFPPPESWRIDYGIGQYFVPEGTGRALEDLREDGRLRVEVRVGNDGRGVISALIVDGNRIAEKKLF
jgi:uncharacterized membrane-anchored protein